MTSGSGRRLAARTQSGRSLVTITSDRRAEAAGALRAAGAMEVADAGVGDTARKMGRDRDES